jgi:hypothetical protein
MLELISDVALKLATVVATHNPRYPIYIPLDIDGKEWVLCYGEFGPTHEGFFIQREEEGLLRCFNDLFDLIAFFTYKAEVDWAQMEERITIAAMANAAALTVHGSHIAAAFGDDFMKNALPIREALEDAYLEAPGEKSTNDELRITYLTKMLKVPEAEEEKPSGLTLVTKEEE